MEPLALFMRNEPIKSPLAALKLNVVPDAVTTLTAVSVLALLYVPVKLAPDAKGLAAETLVTLPVTVLAV